MEARWLKRTNDETGKAERFYPITHSQAIVTEDGTTLDVKIDNIINEVETIMNEITVTSDIPLHLNVTSDGILQITY